MAIFRSSARPRRIFLIAAAIGIAALDLWLLLPAKAAEPPISVKISFPWLYPDRPLPQSFPAQSALSGFHVPDEGDEDLPPRGEVADASRVLADDVATLGANATYGRALQAMRIFAENGNCLFGIMRDPDSDKVTPHIAWMEVEWVRTAPGKHLVCRAEMEALHFQLQFD
ncbi:hypothetical protein [Novosphingobium sediminis]|uniref:hypothetical protein n=1 Tax=Novosphingobium sediminis TaxID=707214 RepID=UPI0011BDB267|nr:hypothetical protein [Novosphingobium sediminis]